MSTFGPDLNSIYGKILRQFCKNQYMGQGYGSTFGSMNSVPLDTVIMSRTIQTQSTGAIAITSGTGQYQINAGSWVSTAGTVVTGDTIRARVTSSASYETAVALEITIDGVADTFTVTTLAEIVDALLHYTEEEHYTETNHYTD